MNSRAENIQIAQLGALLIAVGAIVWDGGRSRAELDQVQAMVTELRMTVADLARAQAEAAVVDARHSARLEDVLRRLETLK